MKKRTKKAIKKIEEIIENKTDFAGENLSFSIVKKILDSMYKVAITIKKLEMKLTDMALKKNWYFIYISILKNLSINAVNKKVGIKTLIIA